MSLLDKTLKEKLSLKERGLLNDSYFEAILEDNSAISEIEYNWSSFANEEAVTKGKLKKKVLLSTYPLKSLTLNHKGLSHTIYLEKDERAYQYIHSISSFKSDGSVFTEIVGRVIGRVNKENEIIEEVYLDHKNNVVVGWRY